MHINPDITDLITTITNGHLLTKKELISLLTLPLPSPETNYLMATANTINHTATNHTAEVHAQIGINSAPCPKNCQFCSFAAQNQIFTTKHELTEKQLIQQAHQAEKHGANAIYLMTTGDYPIDRFIKLSQTIQPQLHPDTILIANIGDFTLEQAKHLKDIGYTGIYHAIRMGEGTDTHIPITTRKSTIKNAQNAGLLIGTCVEPIGPEHTPADIADKIILARDINPVFSGAMRRIPLPNTHFEQYGMLTEYQLAYLVAITRLAMGTTLAGNCTHEPNMPSALSGANLFWAETGTNPRDIQKETSKGRGIDIPTCQHMLTEAQYTIRKGPSHIFSP